MTIVTIVITTAVILVMLWIFYEHMISLKPIKHKTDKYKTIKAEVIDKDVNEQRDYIRIK